MLEGEVVEMVCNELSLPEILYSKNRSLRKYRRGEGSAKAKNPLLETKCRYGGCNVPTEMELVLWILVGAVDVDGQCTSCPGNKSRGKMDPDSASPQHAHGQSFRGEFVILRTSDIDVRGRKTIIEPIFFITESIRWNEE